MFTRASEIHTETKIDADILNGTGMEVGSGNEHVSCYEAKDGIRPAEVHLYTLEINH
jgi:hypothetical protein